MINRELKLNKTIVIICQHTVSNRNVFLQYIHTMYVLDTCTTYNSKIAESYKNIANK